MDNQETNQQFDQETNQQFDQETNQQEGMVLRTE